MEKEVSGNFRQAVAGPDMEIIEKRVPTLANPLGAAMLLVLYACKKGLRPEH